METKTEPKEEGRPSRGETTGSKDGAGVTVSRETVCLNPWGLSQDADPGAGRPSAPGAGEPPLPAGRAAEGALKEDGQPRGARSSAPPQGHQDVPEGAQKTPGPAGSAESAADAKPLASEGPAQRKEEERK